MFTTTDGRYLAVSRPSFADVVWIDIAKAVAEEPGAIVHEEQMDGYRTDHMDDAGTTLCVAGTMDDYAALVDRRTMKYTIFDTQTTGNSYGKP